MATTTIIKCECGYELATRSTDTKKFQRPLEDGTFEEYAKRYDTLILPEGIELLPGARDESGPFTGLLKKALYGSKKALRKRNPEASRRHRAQKLAESTRDPFVPLVLDPEEDVLQEEDVPREPEVEVEPPGSFSTPKRDRTHISLENNDEKTPVNLLCSRCGEITIIEGL